MLPVSPNPLFQTLLGNRDSLNAALDQASKRIAGIAKRKTFNGFRSVKRDGVSVTRLYDYQNITAGTSKK